MTGHEAHLRVLSVFGTRPEAVKMAPIVKRLASTPGIESKVCVTAQHRQMLDQVLDLFAITPDYDLDLMRPNQSLAEISAAIFTHLEPIITQLQPDWILAQGDTTTVLTTSLLAYYHHVHFGHVEAGLRSGDKWQPFPEEINRKVATLTADLHFAPTEWSRQNLLHEHVPPELILVTGNPVIDALHEAVRQPETQQIQDLLMRIGLGDGSDGKRLILVTAHRRENFGQPITNICSALRTLAEDYANSVHFLYPVHLNPNVQEPVYRMLSGIDNITLMPPLDYLPMVQVMKHAWLVLTDSGGLQEEAPGLGVPVLVLREVTERPEGVSAGTVRLVGTSPDRIIKETHRLMDNLALHTQMSQAVNPYGDGHASERIVSALLQNHS